jgi:hypothetical protein
MNPNDFQFPKSLKGFQNRGVELPETVSSFSSSALAGHKATKFSQNVKVLEPRNGAFSAMPKEEYNKASTDLVNMRKSGEAAAYGASISEFRDAHGLRAFPKDAPIKINTNPSK